MTVQIKKLSNNNLLSNFLSYWTAGQGSVSGFALNGLTSESTRLYDTGPYGKSVLVWGTYPSGDNGADGGWEGSNVTIDNTKLYRHSVWMRRTSSTTGGTFYFGLHTNGTGDVLRLQDGGSETNPYFDYRGIQAFSQNQWYLVVGHLWPSSTANGTSPHVDSGIWTKNGGKVYSLGGNIPFDCKSPSNATGAMNRTYHYYCGDSTSRLQFYSPRIEVVDGTQPTIEHLLNVDFTDPTVLPEAIVYGDGSIQATSGNAPSKDHGELISMSSYTTAGTFTWSRPTNCSRILVKLVGGGGGAAGYCESGGGGGYAEKLISVENVSNVTVTVGGGGSNTGYYAAGGNGGTSSFGSYLSASGGYGSNQNVSHSGGYGGVGSSGDVNLYGGTGTGHSNGHSSGANARGGSTPFGGGTATFRNNGGGRFAPAAPGNGGAGGRTDANYAGGTGKEGAVFIWEYK